MDFYALASVMRKKLDLLVHDPLFLHWLYRRWAFLKIRVDSTRGLEGATDRESLCGDWAGGCGGRPWWKLWGAECMAPKQRFWRPGHIEKTFSNAPFYSQARSALLFTSYCTPCCSPSSQLPKGVEARGMRNALPPQDHTTQPLNPYCLSRRQRSYKHTPLSARGSWNKEEVGCPRARTPLPRAPSSPQGKQLWATETLPERPPAAELR